jgi:hypothetical protein
MPRHFAKQSEGARQRNGAPTPASLFLATLSEALPHSLGNQGRETMDQSGELGIDGADLRFQTLDPRLQAIHLPYQCGQIIAVAPGLFENMSRDEFRALNFAFEHFELFPSIAACIVLVRACQAMLA